MPKCFFGPRKAGHFANAQAAHSKPIRNSSRQPPRRVRKCASILKNMVFEFMKVI